MKNIDKFNLIDQIGRELQSRMTYSDIDIYLVSIRGRNYPAYIKKAHFVLAFSG
jgi:hypothetical protein